MKRFVYFALIFMLSLPLCSCGDASSGESADTSSALPVASTSASNANAAISADSGVFDVTLTIPADFVDKGTTQEDCDRIASEKGYKSVTLNGDGSTTYVISKSQHKKMMEDLTKSIDDGLKNMVGSENFPNITAIDANDDYTEFTVSIKGESLELKESVSTLAYYMYGGMYNSFSGNKVDNISVKFVNDTSGTVIKEANSKDAG